MWPSGRVDSPRDSISSRTKIDLGAASHRGKVRARNEDTFLVARFERSLHALLTNLPAGMTPEPYAEAGYVMLLADGMGGAAAGDVASRTAITGLVELFIQTPDWIMRPDAERVPEVLLRMKGRLGRLADILTERAGADPGLSGMGTTLTLAASLGPELVVAHVGASRAYIFRRGHLLRLTSDQTVAQLLAEAGVISPEEVPEHFARHTLTSSISVAGGKAEVELRHVKLADGDQFLLCSDGLPEMVPEDRISEVLRKHLSAADASRTLVGLALEAGGEDNVTVILCRYHIPEE
jgi:serine/threonine protein phosphatase PrpC